MSFPRLTILLIAAMSLVLLLGAGVQTTRAEQGDTTWVQTYSQDFFNWADWHTQTFTFPDSSLHSSKVVLFYTIGCPSAPADCDPWDRKGYLRLLRDTGPAGRAGDRTTESIEIARVITPYDITGGTRPGTCTWQLDVSDFEPLLHGQVTLSNYIETYIGGDKGWLVTVKFAFVGGVPDLTPIKISNLWQNDYVIYGDPALPLDTAIPIDTLDIDPLAEVVKVRVTTTGHGQGNTLNCAEFCSRQHTVVANGMSFPHNLWRSDCATNACSPQGGTWQYARAGWCPGDKVNPWIVDVSSAVTAGSQAILDYNIQVYENLCRPSNPSCVTGTTCTDCQYNYTGHTEPHYAVQGQLIQYKRNLTSGVGQDGGPGLPAGRVSVEQNRPNPFTPPTWIQYTLRDPASIRVAIYDASGRVVREIHRRHDVAGTYQVQWDGRDDRGAELPSGVYFYDLRSGGTTAARKMLLLKDR